MTPETDYTQALLEAESKDELLKAIAAITSTVLDESSSHAGHFVWALTNIRDCIGLTQDSPQAVHIDMEQFWKGRARIDHWYRIVGAMLTVVVVIWLYALNGRGWTPLWIAPLCGVGYYALVSHLSAMRQMRAFYERAVKDKESL